MVDDFVLAHYGGAGSALVGGNVCLGDISPSIVRHTGDPFYGTISGGTGIDTRVVGVKRTNVM